MKIKSKYVFGYMAIVFVIVCVYLLTRTEASTQEKAYFANVDLPVGSIVASEDISYTEGIVTEIEKGRLIMNEQEVVGQMVTGYGIRAGRPVLKGDVTQPNDKYTLMKLAGDITTPQGAKVVDVILIYDERTYPGRGWERLAEGVPVEQVYNSQNIAIEDSDTKQNKVPKAIEIWVNQEQEDKILRNITKGVLRFNTIP